MKKCFLFFLFLLILSSCSDGWKKDPFEDESESVKNAVPFLERKRKIPPPDRDVIFMNFEPFYSVVEGTDLKIPVKYNIGHDEVKFQRIVVRSSNNFPGLVYDEQNEIITITPPEETVDISSKFKLQVVEVSLFAEYKGVILESISKINVMIVPRLENRGVLPKVIKIVDLPTKVLFGREKVEQDFKVYVYGSTEQPPRLQVYSDNGGSRYITVDQTPVNAFKDEEILENCNCAAETKEDGLDIWEFKAKLVLPKEMRIFTTADKYQATFVAYSIYGVPSASRHQWFTVSLDKAQEPDFVGRPVVDFFKNAWNRHAFMIVDKSGLSKVSATCESPPGSTCQCQEEGSSSASCTLQWKPEATGEFEVNVNKISQVFDGDDLIDESSVEEKFRVHVIEPKDGGKTPFTPPPAPVVADDDESGGDEGKGDGTTDTDAEHPGVHPDMEAEGDAAYMVM